PVAASAAAPPPGEQEAGGLLHLLVFGRPGSGKSSLLAALAEAARESLPALQGQLTAAAPGLEQLGRQGLPPGAGSAVSYRVHYDPTGEKEDVDAVLVDSEGLA